MGGSGSSVLTACLRPLVETAAAEAPRRTGRARAIQCPLPQGLHKAASPSLERDTGCHIAAQ